MERSDPDDRVGDVVLGGKIAILRRVGGGGMGAVYEVEHRLTGHHRALKIVLPRYAEQPRFMTRLLREARVASELDTPHVVQTYDAGKLEDGSAYVLMELLAGRSLYSLVRERGELEVAQVARVAMQVCEGLTAAHGAGIVHRDIKPENIFLAETKQGEVVKLLDFGVSKFPEQQATSRLTQEGTILGTPFYMSPEQAAGRPLDPRTDLYSLGVVMYEALTGRLPFEDRTIGGLFLKIGAGECVPLGHYRSDIDEAFAKLVHKAFQRMPNERFQTAEELRTALAPFAGTIEHDAGARSRSTAEYEGLPPAAEGDGPRQTTGSDRPSRERSSSEVPRKAATASGRGGERSGAISGERVSDFADVSSVELPVRATPFARLPLVLAAAAALIVAAFGLAPFLGADEEPPPAVPEPSRPRQAATVEDAPVPNVPTAPSAMDEARDEDAQDDAGSVTTHEGEAERRARRGERRESTTPERETPERPNAGVTMDDPRPAVRAGLDENPY